MNPQVMASVTVRPPAIHVHVNSIMRVKARCAIVSWRVCSFLHYSLKFPFPLRPAALSGQQISATSVTSIRTLLQRR